MSKDSLCSSGGSKVDHIVVDGVYYYKGNFYLVKGYAKIQSSDGEWVEGVIYKNYRDECFVRPLTDFAAKFKWKEYYQW